MSQAKKLRLNYNMFMVEGYIDRGNLNKPDSADVLKVGQEIKPELKGLRKLGKVEPFVAIAAGVLPVALISSESIGDRLRRVQPLVSERASLDSQESISDSETVLLDNSATQV